MGRLDVLLLIFNFFKKKKILGVKNFPLLGELWIVFEDGVFEKMGRKKRWLVNSIDQL